MLLRAEPPAAFSSHTPQLVCAHSFPFLCVHNIRFTQERTKSTFTFLQLFQTAEDYVHLEAFHHVISRCRCTISRQNVRTAQLQHACALCPPSLSPRVFNFVVWAHRCSLFLSRISRPAAMVRSYIVANWILLCCRLISVCVQERRSSGRNADPQDQDHPHQPECEELGKRFVV